MMMMIFKEKKKKFSSRHIEKEEFIEISTQKKNSDFISCFEIDRKDTRR